MLLENMRHARTSESRSTQLAYADGDAKLLVTRYLPGELAQGSEHEHLPETYRQAGRLLAELHGQFAVEDEEFELREKEEWPSSTSDGPTCVRP
jgi:hypothetical protein